VTVPSDVARDPSQAEIGHRIERVRGDHASILFKAFVETAREVQAPAEAELINRREGIKLDAAACLLDGLFHKALLYEVVSIAEVRKRAVRAELKGTQDVALALRPLESP
jgi:hypothetical protein